MSFSAVGIGTRTFTRDAGAAPPTGWTLSDGTMMRVVLDDSDFNNGGIAATASASGVTRFTAHSDGAAWWVG
jgi:hypothetical protein